MFQDFTSAVDPANGTRRVALLRARLRALSADAFLVPRADRHMGEYVAACDERLAWLTGFTGSAGMAVITVRDAALFVDGRYTLQAASQVDPATFVIEQIPDADPVQWLIRHLPKGAKVGFDPWLHTVAAVRRMDDQLAEAGLALKALVKNPVDTIWGRDRPPLPLGAVIPQALEHAGTPSSDKIAALQKQLKAGGEDAVILTLPDSISWLFNIRGSDVKHNPTVSAFAIVPAAGKPELFIDKRKVGGNVKPHLTAVARLREPDELSDRVDALKSTGKRVRLDGATAASWFARRLRGKARISEGVDPCLFPKARKNDAEIAGARAAHVRDGAAVVRFLAWLDGATTTGQVDEITAVRKLEGFRAETGALKEISFDTISGSGPNGAIVHYRVTEATNRRLGPGELFLVDSGGQYADGTTDITRTVAIGNPTQEMRDRFTLVLKGHIAISRLRFPAGTTGAHIDAFARHALWQHGLDFDHGTGHGVGSYLSVHEGPQSISKRGHVALEPGMIVSNEPGYYKTDGYGIRIENLLLVTPATQIAGGERAMMGFEVLTLVPIDRRLVEPRLLSSDELEWLDAYHRRVANVVGKELSGKTAAWLAAATARLGT